MCYFLHKVLLKNRHNSLHFSDYLKIKVNDEKNLSWCLDGEKYEINGNTIEIKVDRNTKIMLPKTKIDELFTKKEG